MHGTDLDLGALAEREHPERDRGHLGALPVAGAHVGHPGAQRRAARVDELDRKSTRLNSSH